MEEGAYVVKERSGLRTLTIPARDKPGALNADVLRAKAAAGELTPSVSPFCFSSMEENIFNGRE